jgi:hypothetical protein
VCVGGGEGWRQFGQRRGATSNGDMPSWLHPLSELQLLLYLWHTPDAVGVLARAQVTSPQLSMLESALENMDRVDAFIMLRNHRSPGNVFEEAHRCGWVGGRGPAPRARGSVMLRHV